MRGMELHFGVIRDRQTIHVALQHSKSLKRQLAICYYSEGKLLVKICTVSDVLEANDGVTARLQSLPEGPESEFTVRLENIQSIYPIRDFNSEKPEPTGEMEWPEDPEPAV